MRQLLPIEGFDTFAGKTVDHHIDHAYV